MAEETKPKAPSERSKAIKKKIEREMEQRREQHRQEMMRKRIELARLGLKAFEAGKFTEAGKQFLIYIRILEDWKKVSQGTLNPHQFDLRNDAAELLLISSVYWHLVKLYDKSPPGSNGEQEFRHYMQQYILFSKGMTYQPLSAETLRKFMRSQQMVHRQDFRNAYVALTGSKCFVATSLADRIDDDTLPRLREFRDVRLARSRAGRAFTRFYYLVGPGLAWGMDRMPERVRRRAAGSIDRLAAYLYFFVNRS